jgi:hypothetical protein
MKIIRLWFLAVLVSTGLTGCLSDESYESCEYPPQQHALCVSTSGGVGSQSCSVEHPECPDHFCVTYRGSSPFCSMACIEDKDCPGNAKCIGFAMGCTGEEGEDPSACSHYCVPSSEIK